jgi:translation initiation factor 2B subunit (eIF-2B alpha/beta/delta family)
MTFGKSKTILDFLTKTKQGKGINFEVFVVESSQSGADAQEMAKQLRRSNIIANVIPQKAIFAIMQSVSKVLICKSSALTSSPASGDVGRRDHLQSGRAAARPCR